jgi:type VI secretion system protein ImpL
MKRWLARFDLRQVAIGLLAAWAVGLVVAAVQLEMWQNQLTRTLVQLSADAQFRARVAHQREQVDPEWYRRKALSLLAAMEKIRQNTRWMVFVPGSWRQFDDLEERLSTRLEREFGEIVLETMRRELFARASKLTGAPQHAGGGEFRQPLECAAPPYPPTARALSTAPEDLPEFAGVRDWLASLQALDAAVQSWTALQTPGQADPEHLRRLVRYTLDADLPGPASRSLELFGAASDEPQAQPGAAVAALQGATRCTLAKGMAALHTRLLANNDLLTREQALAGHSAGLFDASRPLAFAPAVERYRAVHAILQDQEALLAEGRNAWMRQDTLALGPGYEALLQQVAGTQLLGPPVVQQLRGQAQHAFAQFRRRFDALYASPRPGVQPGIVWQEDAGRFTLAPERVALRQALGGLLQEPFMQVMANGAVPPASDRLEDALVVSELRRRVWREHMPRFPQFARVSVGRVVDARLAQMAYDTAVNALKTSVPQNPAGPLDTAAFNAQRERVAQVQSLLVSLRAAHLAQSLGAQQSGDVHRRLAAVYEELRALPLFDARLSDFSAWRGEAGPLLRAMNAADPASLQAQLNEQYASLEALGRRAEQYLALGDPTMAADPVAQRWQRLLRELERYRARQADSSMVALERYMLALGPYLRRENCAENLSAQAPPRYQDDVALRLGEMHNALVQRCSQLRSAALGSPGFPPARE